MAPAQENAASLNKTLVSSSKKMRAIRSSGSKIEQLLAHELWRVGLRYRRTNRSIFGNPDFTLRKFKIAIFADSEFWHGFDWNRRKRDHRTNIEFWHNKIEANIRRDVLVTRTLEEQGWIVIRFWGKEIKRDVVACVSEVQQAVQLRIKD